jgi:hypothetical protein
VFALLASDVAAVCYEKLDNSALALHYLDAALSTDLPKGGTQLPVARTVFSILRGRILASLGRTVEAVATLEAANEAAHKLTLRLYELQALVELHQLVEEAGQQGQQQQQQQQHAARRLGAVLRELKTPVDSRLSALLKGLDATELRAMAPPEATTAAVHARARASSSSHRSSSDIGRAAAAAERRQDDAVQATLATLLQRELEGLCVKDLRQRAREAGVDAAALEDAADSDDQKSALITLLLELTAADTPHPELEPEPEPDSSENRLAAADLRKEELEQLGVLDLRKRCVAKGVDMKAAMASRTPKAAMIDLLLALPQ